jgi:hypothetical protein
MFTAATLVARGQGLTRGVGENRANGLPASPARQLSETGQLILVAGLDGLPSEPTRHDGKNSSEVSSTADGNSKGLVPLTGAPTPAEWPWPDDLDAMVAAPEFHTVLFEDDRVRVLDGRVPAGATVPVHTHRWGGVLYILATSDFVRRDPDGHVLADTKASKSTPILGAAAWGAPLTPHSLENVGSEEFRTLTVEMKDGSGQQAT